MKSSTILTEKQAELSNCTFVKTVLMLIVVIYHCIVFWTGTWFTKNPIYESSILSILSYWLNSFHIYGFTLVSGYLFYFLKHEIGKYSNFLQFISNKTKRLLIPYTVISLTWAIPFAIYFSQISVEDVVSHYVLGTSPSQLWFLLMLFCVFMIFYPLSTFFQKHNYSGAIVLFLLYGFGLVGAMILPNILQVFRAFTFIPFFWLGFKIRQYGSQLLKKIPTLMWVIADILLFVVVQLLSGYDGIIFTLLNIGLNFILHIVGALMAFVVLQKVADRIKWKQSNIFVLLSNNSMPMYLFHQQVIYIFVSSLNGLVNPYLHTGIIFSGTMVISLLISVFLMKFKITRHLLGEK